MDKYAEIKEILYNQLLLLAEESKNSTDLAQLTMAMVEVAKVYQSFTEEIDNLSLIPKCIQNEVAERLKENLETLGGVGINDD